MKLVIRATGPDISKQYVVDSQSDTSITVGRGKDCAIPLPGADRTISRQHLRLRFSGDSVVVEVVSASNGADSSLGLIEPGQSLRLGPGEFVKLGAYRFDIDQFDELRHTAAVLLEASAGAAPPAVSTPISRDDLGDLFSAPQKKDEWFETTAGRSGVERKPPSDPFSDWNDLHQPGITSEGAGYRSTRDANVGSGARASQSWNASKPDRGTSFDQIASGGRDEGPPASAAGEFAAFLRDKPKSQDRRIAPEHVHPVDMLFDPVRPEPAAPWMPQEPRPAVRTIESGQGAAAASDADWDAFGPPVVSPSAPPPPARDAKLSPSRPDLEATRLLDQQLPASTAEVFDESWGLDEINDPSWTNAPKALPRPTDTSAPTTTSSSTWAAFARGLELPATPTLDEAAAERVGKIIRELVIGLSSMLQARHGWKREMRIIDRTELGSTGNNPLKLLSAEECLNEIFLQRKGYMPLDDAVSQSIQDLQLHQAAEAEATRAAIIGTLTYFDPDRMAQEHSRHRLGMFATLDKARLWDHFLTLHAGYSGDVAEWLDMVFRDHYVRAYERRSSQS